MRFTRTLALVTALVLLLSSSLSCGYILHPERRGNRGGQIDTVTLIFDILWLIPGIIPGVVALAIDFSSGAIYTGGGGRAHRVRDGKLAVRLPRVDRETKVELRLVGRKGELLASARTVLAPYDPPNRRLEIDLARASARAKELAASGEAHLELVGPGGKSAPLALELGK